MDTKKLKEYNLLKGTGKNTKIGVPYPTEKGHKIRWVQKPSQRQWEFIRDHIENNDPPKKTVKKKTTKK